MVNNSKELKHFANDLRNQLFVSSTKERKAGAEAYMRSQFEFIGVDTTTRREVFKAFVSCHEKPLYNDLLSLINEMWQMERELQYCAIELAALYKKEWQHNFIEIIHACVIKKSWWDTVDHMATEWIGPYFKL